MNLNEFYDKYKNFRQKHKIIINCDICGSERHVSKEKVEQNIKKHGKYVDRPCAMKISHALNPVSDDTKIKQRNARLGMKLSEETKQKMSESAKTKWETEWGIEQKKRLSKQASELHGRKKIDKSKRKVLYISAKNNNEIRMCSSSYEFIFCEFFLEKDENLIKYETQVSYKVNDNKYRSLDVLAYYKDGKIKVFEIKPKKRLNEIKHKEQIDDSRKNAEKNNYLFEVLTEKELNIKKSIDATNLADEYRKKHYLINYADYRKEKNKERSKRFYNKNIAIDKVLIFCDFCKTYHSRLRKLYENNIKKNGRFICIYENGFLVGKKPKIKKENPYANINCKECIFCHRILPFECFSPDNSRRDGYSSKCKECRAEFYRNKYKKS